MKSYLQAIAVIFLLFVGWIAIQQFARRFARRHPEFGPAKKADSAASVADATIGKIVRNRKRTGRKLKPLEPVQKERTTDLHGSTRIYTDRVMNFLIP